MNNSKSNTRFMIYITMLCSIQVILMLTPLGFIQVTPFLRVTTMHIPVILGGILFGVKGGAILGFVFGLGSLITNTLTPGLMSFLFSPLAPPMGDFHGNFWSLVIVFGPRILLGVISAYIYKFFQGKKHETMGSLVTSIVATLLHSIMVLGLIALFFGEAYAAGTNNLVSDLFTVMLGIIATNGLIEAALAAFIVTALVKVLEPMIKKVK